MIGWVGAVNAMGNLILRFVLVILALMVRRELKKWEIPLLKFYDLIIISFAIYAVSKDIFPAS